jgi:hypothetical protein
MKYPRRRKHCVAAPQVVLFADKKQERLPQTPWKPPVWPPETVQHPVTCAAQDGGFAGVYQLINPPSGGFPGGGWPSARAREFIRARI